MKGKSFSFLLCAILFFTLTSFTLKPSVCGCESASNQKISKNDKGFFTGIILEKAGGLPMQKVALFLRNENHCIYVGRSNKKGKFAKKKIPDGIYTLIACQAKGRLIEINGIQIKKNKPFYINVFVNQN